MTDSGLKELVPLKDLTSLNLSFTKITDASIKELAQMTHLTELDLNLTKSDEKRGRGTPEGSAKMQDSGVSLKIRGFNNTNHGDSNLALDLLWLVP